MHIKILVLLGLLAFTLLTGGCGNKGDLYKADPSAGTTYKPD